MTSFRAQLAGIAVLADMARLQACRRCGQPHSAHLDYRDNPTASRACSRYRAPRQRIRIIFWRKP
jgi:hypothetical protein